MTVDVTTITVEQFQTQFSRGFPYFDSIQYSSTATYNMGQKVYYPSTQLFYVALQNGLTNIAPNSDATKWQISPDDPDNYVQDGDITNAFGEARAVFNVALYSTDQTITLAYLYLSAHFLANDLKAALAGIMAPAAFPVSSKSAGSVSESYSIPQRYLDDPILAQYTSSSYGMKYLAMTLPALSGNMMAVAGSALP